jgi:hypothetical protein
MRQSAEDKVARLRVSEGGDPQFLAQALMSLLLVLASSAATRSRDPEASLKGVLQLNACRLQACSDSRR